MRHRAKAMLFRICVCLPCAVLLAAVATPAGAQLLTSSDLSRLRSVGGVALSPDNQHIAYTITMRDRPGRPYGQLWVMDLSTRRRVFASAATSPPVVHCGLVTAIGSRFAVRMATSTDF